ncbi:MAG: trypsin-like serine protease, partial [Solirubrobacteraceae bacterium]
LVPVARAIVEPDYLAGSGSDITLLQLARPATQAPTKVAGSSGGSLWAPGVSEQIAGWCTTSEGGDTPDTLQKARVPITTDADCAKAYSDFDARTMVCAGYPQGGTDTCQGDSGGPAPRATARAARGRASPVSTPAWPTRRCASGSARRRPTASTEHPTCGDAPARRWVDSGPAPVCRPSRDGGAGRQALAHQLALTLVHFLGGGRARGLAGLLLCLLL